MAAEKLPVKLVGELKGINPHEGPVRNVRFNGSGGYCLTCGSDKQVKLWNPHKGTLLKTYTGHGYEVLDATASQDNGRVASCGEDRMVILWDVATGQVIRKFRGHTQRVNAVKFNQPEATVILSASYDASLRAWDCRSRSYDPIQIMEDAKDSVTSLQVSTHEILTGSVDCKVRNYDLRMGRLYADHTGSPVTSVSFSADGQCVLASSLDNTIRLLDKDNGELLNEFQGHKNEDYKVDSCFSSDDSHIVSGSEDGKICFWDLIEGTLVMTKDQAHKSIVYSLSYHPKEDCLLSASSDGTVKLWRTNDWTSEEDS